VRDDERDGRTKHTGRNERAVDTGYAERDRRTLRAGAGQLFLPGRRRRGDLTVTYLTNQLPFPAHSGGQLREAQLLARAGASADIDLFVLTENFGRDARHAGLAAAHCTSVRVHASVPAPPGGPPDDVPERVWRYESAAFDTALRKHLAAWPPDVVHVEGYFLARHLPADLRVPLVIVAENVEYLIDRDQQRHEPGRGAPWTVSRERELAALSRATIIGAVCREDADIIARDLPRLPVSVFPNGADHLGADRAGADDLEAGHLGADQPRAGDLGAGHPGVGREKAAGRAGPAPRVSFVGNYSWQPTLNGAWSLVREIWPRVRATHPTARLALVGTGIPADLHAAAEAAGGIAVVGEVEHVRPVLAATDIFVCPLWIRSGIKVKMIEALSAGCAVVCTTAALRGLPDAVRRAVVTADDPPCFAAAIGSLLDDPVRRRRLSTMAKGALASFPTWDEAAGILLEGWRRARAGVTQEGVTPEGPR
jgi:glycosyltransferase involved in cell wall biosynthesis